MTPDNTDVAYIPADPESAELPDQIFSSEIKAIRERRRTYHLPLEQLVPDNLSPDVGNGLVGLSLSGGGIRSSTFNLGVLQSLDEAKVLQRVDYLSTVSGGGYIGSCLSSFWAGNPDMSIKGFEVCGVPGNCLLSAGQKTDEGIWRLDCVSGTEVTLILQPDGDLGEFNHEITATSIPVSDDQSRIPVPVFLVSATADSGLSCRQQPHGDNNYSTVVLSGRPENKCFQVALQIGVSGEFPFRHAAGQLESPPFRHLRERASYLKPPTPFSCWRFPGLFLRGLLINALIVLPFLLFAAVFTVLLARNDIYEAINTAKHEYVIHSKTDSSSPAEYRRIDLNLQPYVSWTEHNKQLDYLLVGVPEDATLSLNLSGGEKELSRLDDDTWLIKHTSDLKKKKDLSTLSEQKDFGVNVILPSSQSATLTVTAWESGNRFEWLNSRWGYKLRSLVPVLFDAWKKKVRIESVSTAGITESKSNQFFYFLNLSELCQWRKYVLLSGVPQNSFSKEGTFVGEGRWLFRGDAAADLRLSLSIPNLERDVPVHISAWQSVHYDEKISHLNHLKSTAKVALQSSTGGPAEKEVKLILEKDGGDRQRPTYAEKVTGTGIVAAILQTLGYDPGQENLYVWVSGLLGRDCFWDDKSFFNQGARRCPKEHPPAVNLISRKDHEWVFKGDGINDLEKYLQVQFNGNEAQKISFGVTVWQGLTDAQILDPAGIVKNTSSSHGGANLFARLWRSFNSNGVLDPVSQIFREMFSLTKRVLLIFCVLLLCCPLVQWCLKLFGLKGWRLRDILTRYLCGACILFLLCLAFIEAQPVCIFLFQRLKESMTLTSIVVGADKGIAFISTITAAIGGLFAANSVFSGAKLSSKISLYAMGVIGPLVLWIFYLNFCLWALANENVPSWFANVEGFVLWVYIAVGLAIYLLSQLMYNVNMTSLHPFYRDRLSQTFLISKDKKQGELFHNDEQKLQTLDTRLAPYHILNTTMNVTGKGSANLKGRKADFFSFSRDFIGSRVTGYVTTSEYEKKDNHIGLGTVMAISGAAAAPCMGRETNRCLTFIMALLNVRLGYWAKNPLVFRPAAQKGWWTALKDLVATDQVGPLYLLKEMIGLINEKSRLVNLSDGGHLENMGLYELVRRRCKFIIVCDSEADKEISCHGFADSIRMILIDMGVRIHIDLSDIYREKRAADGSFAVTGKQHYALGTIEYGNGSGERGYLLYIKSSMGGKHSPYIDDYHFNHPDFPHESTADQFFDEAQFEAYRAMGCEIGDDVLKCIGAGTGVLDDQSGEKTQARALDAERNWREFLVAAGKQSHAFTQA